MLLFAVVFLLRSPSSSISRQPDGTHACTVANATETVRTDLREGIYYNTNIVKENNMAEANDKQSANQNRDMARFRDLSLIHVRNIITYFSIGSDGGLSNER